MIHEQEKHFPPLLLFDLVWDADAGASVDSTQITPARTAEGKEQSFNQFITAAVPQPQIIVVLFSTTSFHLVSFSTSPVSSAAADPESSDEH